jgi:transcriptional regulator with XRE-family HTH domain
MNVAPHPVGEKLRAWRQRRRMSQLDLACEAEVSTRHLSFVETGRASASRDMLLNLAGSLEMPLRERNSLLLAAGYAPVFAERRLEDPAMAPAREAIKRLLAAHEPFPALAVDRHWTLIDANAAVAPLLAGVDPRLLAAPVNVLRLSLHPDGLAPRIANLAQWRGHLLERLRRQHAASGDAALAELLDELQAYPGGCSEPAGQEAPTDIAIPLRLVTGRGVLSFLSTTMLFGTPLDVTLSELAIETFLPADAATAEALRKIT